MTRVIPLCEVVKLMRTGLEKAFECQFEFADEDSFFVIFYVDGDDMLTIQANTDGYWVCEYARVEAPNLFRLSRAMHNAAALATALQMTALPVPDFGAPAAASSG